MPIDKQEPRKSDVDPGSLKQSVQLQNLICCSECSDTNSLRRVRDSEGRKIKPAQYICEDCYQRDLRIRS